MTLPNQPPFPVGIVIHPTESGLLTNFHHNESWLRDTENGDKLEEAKEDVIEQYGMGSRIVVRFTAAENNPDLVEYELLGPADEERRKQFFGNQEDE